MRFETDVECLNTNTFVVSLFEVLVEKRLWRPDHQRSSKIDESNLASKKIERLFALFSWFANFRLKFNRFRLISRDSTVTHISQCVPRSEAGGKTSNWRRRQTDEKMMALMHNRVWMKQSANWLKTSVGLMNVPFGNCVLPNDWSTIVRRTWAGVVGVKVAELLKITLTRWWHVDKQLCKLSKRWWARRCYGWFGLCWSEGRENQKVQIKLRLNNENKNKVLPFVRERLVTVSWADFVSCNRAHSWKPCRAAAESKCRFRFHRPPVHVA